MDYYRNLGIFDIPRTTGENARSHKNHKFKAGSGPILSLSCSQHQHVGCEPMVDVNVHANTEVVTSERHIG